MTNYISWDNYPLTTGTTTEAGLVEQVALTAYKIGGEWVPFHKIHGPRLIAESLVVIR
jgi:hypothetical protein